MKHPSTIRLVVARYKEDLRWLRRVPSGISVMVFNKGLDPALPVGFPGQREVSIRPLSNIGREAHSYLTYLIENWDGLSDVMVFSQGHPFDHAPDFHDRLRALAEGHERPDPFLWYGFLDETDDPFGRRLFVPWSKNTDGRELATGRLYEELFGEPPPLLFHFRGGAQFAVTREVILSRPLAFYQRALALCVEIPDAAHSYERIWDRLFGGAVIDPGELGPDGVRYRKRIRWLEEDIGSQKDSDSD